MPNKKPAAKVRTTSKMVATKPGCKPLKDMYDRAVRAGPKSWNEVEGGFLRAMEAFDDNVVSGTATMGELQNGKGDFFNDLLALLLENCAGIALYSRGDVPGLIIPRHKLDVTYPPEGIVEFMLEAKVVGTPKHPGSPKAEVLGRPGAADLDKRMKEIGFKAIDLKAEYGRQKAQRGEGPNVTGDLTKWLRLMKPTSYLFISARVVSENDLARVIGFANVAGQVNDAVGVFAFQPIAEGQWTRYEAVKVPPHIELERVLYRACQDLVGLKDAEPEMPVAPSPAQEVLEIPLPEASEEYETAAGTDEDYEECAES